jgi:hypothetical protein
MRYDCSKNGCYNKTLRPKIETFAECFPRKIGMSDVDAIVEIGGKFLMIEWKAKGGSLGRGQEIMFEKLTSEGKQFVVYVVEGCPETMEVRQFSRYYDNRVQRFVCADGEGLGQLKSHLKRWADFAGGLK